MLLRAAGFQYNWPDFHHVSHRIPCNLDGVDWKKQRSVAQPGGLATAHLRAPRSAREQFSIRAPEHFATNVIDLVGQWENTAAFV
jgi:hypothetical protein